MRALAFRRVRKDVALPGRGFGQGDVLGDDSRSQIVAEALGHQRLNLGAHVAAAVEAGQQETALDAALQHRFDRPQRALDLHRAAQQVFKESQCVIDSIADKNIIHKNTAARYKSRLSAAIKAL